MTTEQREPLYASTAKPWLKYYDQKYIDMPLPKCSAFEYLCHQNKNHLSETALEYYGRKFTFADLFVNVKKTAAAFRALGVKKGDIITVVSVMTPEVIYAFYAVDMIGATLNLVDPRYSVEGIHEYIEEVDSRLLICLNVTYERCHKAEKRTNVERVLVISPADSLPLHLAVGYKLTNPDKNRYKSNVIHWKDFIAQGKDQSMNAEHVLGLVLPDQRAQLVGVQIGDDDDVQAHDQRHVHAAGIAVGNERRHDVHQLLAAAEQVALGDEFVGQRVKAVVGQHNALE